MSRILVTGSGGFLGGALCARLIADGHEVIGADIKPHAEWWQRPADAVCFQADVRNFETCTDLMKGVDQVYHLASAMGGRGYIDSEEIACAGNAVIDLNMLRAAAEAGVHRFFQASSACVYPKMYQHEHALWVALKESTVGPPYDADGVYGSQKLYSEIACGAYRRAKALDIRIGRLHGAYGPLGDWDSGKEKAPAALMRKAIESRMTGKPMRVWGTGTARRSFMYADDAVEGMVRLMASDVTDALNLGSEEMVTIADLARLCVEIAGGDTLIHYVDGPVGVHGRSSDNTLIREKLGWEPTIPLRDGLQRLHDWLKVQMA